MKTIMLHKNKIQYNDTGSGPVVILLHNGFYATETWDGVREELAKNFRVIDYNRPGYGAPGAAFTRDGKLIEEGASDLAILIDQLELEKVHLIGHCIGGAIALVYAAQYPTKVEKITAEAVGFFGNKESVKKCEFVFCPFDELDEKNKTLLKKMHGDQYASEFWRTGGTIKNCYIMTEDYDLRPVLKNIITPVLLINGDRDFFFKPEHCREGADNIADSRVWIADNAGHDVHMEKTEEFVARVRDFFIG